MQPLIDLIHHFYLLSSGSLSFYLLDIGLLLGFLALLARFLGGLMTQMRLTVVLSQEDNAAAGVALAGGLVAIATMFMGVASGDVGQTWISELSLILGYGMLGMVMMWLARQIFDRVNLGTLSIQQAIAGGNMAAAIVDVGTMLATALIVRAVMRWVDGATWIGLMAIVAGFFISQLLLGLANLYRYQVFKRQHAGSGRTLHGEIAAGNSALALRFSGYRIGVGLAVTATSGVVVYDPEWLAGSLLAWLLLALIFFISQTALAVVVRYLVLRGIDVAAEVGEQHNVAIGAMEGAIYIAIGLIFIGLFG